MLAIARKNAIRERLQEMKSVRITELASELSVTKETIRRDLLEMEQNGELIRTHGGAYILDGVQNDIDISTRQILMISEKEIIANKVDSLIQNGDYLYLDGSTTCWFIARKIAHRKLTVLTNSLEIANILSSSDTVTLHMIGGEYNAQSKSFRGEGTISNFERYFVDKAIISCRSVSMARGITDTSDDQARLHQMALSHANTRILVADNSKLDNVSFAFVAPITAINTFVMDRDFSEGWKAYLTENHIRFL